MPSTWTDLARAVESALLAQPLDGLLDLHLPRTTLTATWLLPGRVLLEVSGAPPDCASTLHRAGWRTRRPGAWARPGTAHAVGARPAAAHEAAQEAVALLRDLLRAVPEDVELWQPGLPPAPWGEEDDEPAGPTVQDVLW